MSNGSFKSLQIFYSLTLTLKKEIINLPLECDSFCLNLPFYNEYFKVQLFLFRKSYFAMVKHFQRDLFVTQSKTKNVKIPKQSKVGLISCSNRGMIGFINFCRIQKIKVIWVIIFFVFFIDTFKRILLKKRFFRIGTRKQCNEQNTKFFYGN